MAKQFKIKRYRKYGISNSYRARPHPVAIVLGCVALVALVVLGILIYQPFMDFITGDHSVSELEHTELDPLPEESAPPVSQAEEPPPPPVPELGALKAVYLPHDTALDAAALEAFLAPLPGAGINAVLVDIKKADGNIRFNTSNERALEWGAVLAPIDLRILKGQLEELDLSLVVRMQAFRDPLAAFGDSTQAVRYMDTEILWIDNDLSRGGKPWLNPNSPTARRYLMDLASEAVDAGAAMVVLDSVQFPPFSDVYANFGGEGLDRAQVLRAFVEEFTAAMEEKGAKTALYITAASVSQEADHATLYGGNPLAITDGNVLLSALPYQFGGPFDQDGLVLPEPQADPAATVTAILNYAASKTGGSATLIPVLQGGSEPGSNDLIPFGAEQVQAQIAAAQNWGAEEYLLYHTAGGYLLAQPE